MKKEEETNNLNIVFSFVRLFVVCFCLFVVCLLFVYLLNVLQMAMLSFFIQDTNSSYRASCPQKLRFSACIMPSVTYCYASYAVGILCLCHRYLVPCTVDMNILFLAVGIPLLVPSVSDSYAVGIICFCHRHHIVVPSAFYRFIVGILSRAVGILSLCRAAGILSLYRRYPTLVPSVSYTYYVLYTCGVGILCLCRLYLTLVLSVSCSRAVSILYACAISILDLCDRYPILVPSVSYT